MAEENKENLTIQEKLTNLLLKANKRQVEFQKNLGLSAAEAAVLSTELGKSAGTAEIILDILSNLASFHCKR